VEATMHAMAEAISTRVKGAEPRGGFGEGWRAGRGDRPWSPLASEAHAARRRAPCGVGLVLPLQ